MILRVRVFTDNMAALSVWQNQGAQDSALNQITERLCPFTMKENCEIQMQYVPAVENVADAPSLFISYTFTDTMFSDMMWVKVFSIFPRLNFFFEF